MGAWSRAQAAGGWAGGAVRVVLPCCVASRVAGGALAADAVSEWRSGKETLSSESESFNEVRAHIVPTIT